MPRARILDRDLNRKNETTGTDDGNKIYQWEWGFYYSTLYDLLIAVYVTMQILLRRLVHYLLKKI